MRICILALLLLSACSSTKTPEVPVPDSVGFGDYWNQGKAELTRFRLKQARYGEIYEGDAVQIFVTEPFLEEKQVKREAGDERSYQVLKLNATRNFVTGIYPYSLMTSVFTEVDFAEPFTAKVSFSAQEWCGQVYMQLNAKSRGYQASIHSYFQNEADQRFTMDDALLEDDLWTRIRIAPNKLPLGELTIIPGLHVLRLDHVTAQPYKAKAELTDVKGGKFSDDRLFCYRLAYTDLKRTLTIYFEREQPYRIKGWLEEGESGMGEERVMLTTEAVATHELVSDYWNLHKFKDWTWRKKLGLK